MLSADGLTPKQQLSELRDRILMLIQKQAVSYRDVPPKLKSADSKSRPTIRSRYEKQSLEEYFLKRSFRPDSKSSIHPSVSYFSVES